MSWSVLSHTRHAELFGLMSHLRFARLVASITSQAVRSAGVAGARLHVKTRTAGSRVAAVTTAGVAAACSQRSHSPTPAPTPWTRSTTWPRIDRRWRRSSVGWRSDSVNPLMIATTTSSAFTPSTAGRPRYRGCGSCWGWGTGWSRWTRRRGGGGDASGRSRWPGVAGAGARGLGAGAGESLKVVRSALC